jgi:hypothetical protein
MEERCMRAIYKCFNLEYPNNHIQAYIKKYDLQALYDEGYMLFGVDSFFGDKGKDNILIKSISSLENDKVAELLIKEFYKLTCNNI